MGSLSRAELDAFYDAYPRIEAEFQAVLDASLTPRGPESLYELVRDLGLPPAAGVVDVGCGEGKHTLALAERFGFTVRGIDPVPRHIDLAKESLSAASKRKGELSKLVHFEIGTAVAIPLGDASVDLVWCRDVLVHADSLDKAYAEFRRVLRNNGRIVVYQWFVPTGSSRVRRRGYGRPCASSRPARSHSVRRPPSPPRVCASSNASSSEASGESERRRTPEMAVADCFALPDSSAHRSITSRGSGRRPTTSCSGTLSGTSIG